MFIHNKCISTCDLALTLTYLLHIPSIISNQALMALACNPSYSGGRDQKDPGLKLTQANSS
jgi:hypothetical protein